MSTGLHSQRVTFYTATAGGGDTAYDSGGFAAGEARWASVVYATGTETTVGGQAEQRADAVLTMDDDGRPLPDQVDADGAFRDERGRLFRITDAAPRPRLRAIVVTGVYADDAAASVDEGA